jgi:hypothetical protein
MSDPEEEATRRALDAQRLLPGEDPGTNERDQFAHWVDVYTRLRETKLQLIANLEELMERQPPAVRDELDRSDLQILERQVERFERRLAFWKEKLDSSS